MTLKEEPAEHEETEQGITYRLYLESEEMHPSKYFPAVEDAELVKEIIRQVDYRGNYWYWFCARVEAEFGGFKASVYLGRCSYRNKEQFLQDGWEDMKPEALAMLRKAIQDAIERGEKARLALATLHKELRCEHHNTNPTGVYKAFCTDCNHEVVICPVCNKPQDINGSHQCGVLVPK